MSALTKWVSLTFSTAAKNVYGKQIVLFDSDEGKLAGKTKFIPPTIYMQNKWLHFFNEKENVVTTFTANPHLHMLKNIYVMYKIYRNRENS